MRRFAFPITIALCTLASGLRGDALILRNGQRIEGEILGGTADTIHIRRANESGSKHVDVIDRNDVTRIERQPKGAASRPAAPDPRQRSAAIPAPASRPDTGRKPVGAASSKPAADLSHDTHRELIVAIAKWRAEDFVGAGLDVSRIINSASRDQREAMSAITQATVHRPLAQLAAEIHLRAAIATRRGSAIRVPYVTDYEKSALIPMLVNAYDNTLAARTDEFKIDCDPPTTPGANRPDPSRVHRGVPGPGVPRQPNRSGTTQPWYAVYAQSRPASGPAEGPDRVLAVKDLLDRPDSFEGSSAQAKSLSARVYQALSLLNERIRLDPALRRNADLKRRLLADKQGLLQLAKTLEARSGRSAPKPPPDPEALAAEQARREEFAKRLQEAQAAETKRVAEAQESARKWQEEQEKKQKGFSLFDWLKPSGQNQSAPVKAAPPTETQSPPTPK